MCVCVCVWGINGMRRIAFGIGNNRFVLRPVRNVSIVAFVNWLRPIIEIPLKRKIAKTSH